MANMLYIWIGELYYTDLRQFNPQFIHDRYLQFEIYGQTYIAYSLQYKVYGDIYTFKDIETYPTIICRVKGNNIVEYKCFDNEPEINLNHIEKHFIYS
jgi:hypothetical protein